MVATLIISILTCLFVILSVLFFPSLRIRSRSFPTYPLVALAGAILLLCAGLLPISTLSDGLTSAGSVNPIKILVLFFSMTSLSVYLDEVGFFSYLAAAALRRAGGRQMRLFLLLYALVSVLTVFTSNDVIILTFTPFICYFTKSAGINPMPYLVAEFVAANTWSMTLVIGNPTNIYLAESAGIGFFDYLKVMLIPTAFAGLISLAVLLLVFRRSLSLPMTPIPAEVTFRRRAPLAVGLLHLSLCTILLAVSSYLSLPMWLISFGFALSLFAVGSIVAFLDRRRPYELHRTLQRLPYELIPFVFAMFTIVLALRAYGVCERLAELLSSYPAVLTYGILSFLSANLLNNIPMSVLFSSILDFTDQLGGIYASIVGSNLGAYLTPLGALAGIMWSSLLARNGIKLSFLRFVQYGAVVAIPTLAAALLGLSLVLR